MIIGNKEFKLNEKPYVMGILNVTPDSFPMEEHITSSMMHCMPQSR